MKYTRKVKNLVTGSSLGNLLMFARFDPETNLEGLWHSPDNRFYCGRWKIEFSIDDEKLTPDETIFEPLSQTTKYIYKSPSNKGGVNLTVAKKSFLPYIRMENFEKCKNKIRKLFYTFEIENNDRKKFELLITHEITLPAVNSPFFIKQPPENEKDKNFKITPNGRKLLIEPLNSEEEKRFLIFQHNPDLLNYNDKKIICTQKIEIKPNEKIKSISLFSIGDVENDENIFELFEVISQFSLEEINKVLNNAFVFTPDKTINDGIQWAKVNMCRVEHLYRTGLAFTNDPPQDIVVMRDLAWFVLGSDYVTPNVSHELLKFALKYGIHPDGKVTEYIHANEEKPKLYDYGLNINDDTPLLIWAIYHHANICNPNELSENYDKLKKIANYILTQLKDGLVFSSTDKTGVYGITGWRNIIENYNLSGYVTEINSECIFAIELMAKIANHLCNKNDATKYSNYVKIMRENFCSKLISEITGLPILNHDIEGIKHHDITGDLVFPLLFDVVDDEIKLKIAQKLTQPDIWTEYGARTVSKLEKNYDPEFGYQLMGGIWPNLTAWIGYAVRDFFPEKVYEALKNIYEIVESKNPSIFQNLVPGQFPERFNGENFKSRGMPLSPWMPPTYIWLAIEGLWGFKFDINTIEVKPSIPNNWKWLCIKNLPFRTCDIDAFIYNGKLYISGIENEKITFSINNSKENIIQIEKLNEDGIQVLGNGKIFYLLFKFPNKDGEYVFIASDEGFDGKLKINEKILNVNLATGDCALILLD